MQLVLYDPRWVTEFLVESKRLSERFGSICRRIEHAGSTAIYGLTAKPIIDIQISVTSLQPMAPYKELLEQLGYTHVPHPDDSFCPFFHLPQSWPHSHHVHVVQFRGEEESRTLAFRDYLRDHPGAANEYVALKRSLSKKFA